jgi:hypothetical protein
MSSTDTVNYAQIVSSLLCAVTGAAASSYEGDNSIRMHREICAIEPHLFFPSNDLAPNLDKLELVAIWVGHWINENSDLDDTDGVIWPDVLANALAANHEENGTPLCPPMIELLRELAGRLSATA